MKHVVASALAAVAMAFAGGAQAQQVAYTAKSVHLRAGPARDFPVVAILAPRTSVTVYSCIPDYVWCDVAAGFERGWVYAGNLVYPYDNREVLLPGIAAVIGIGIASFIIDDYWHDHYVDRWWYPQRRRWYRPAPLPPIRTRPPAVVPSHPAQPIRPAPPPRVQPGQPLPRVNPAPQPHVQPRAQPGGQQPRAPERRPPRSGDTTRTIN